MKYKLKTDRCDYNEFQSKLNNIKMINVIIDSDRYGIIVTPSQELVNLINDNCIYGEEDTFKNAMLTFFELIDFNIEKYRYTPVFNWDATKNKIEEEFHFCETIYNASNEITMREKFMNELFENSSYPHVNLNEIIHYS